MRVPWDAAHGGAPHCSPLRALTIYGALATCPPPACHLHATCLPSACHLPATCLPPARQVVQQRLSEEHGVEVIMTAPTVPLQAKMRDGTEIMILSAVRQPVSSRVVCVSRYPAGWCVCQPVSSRVVCVSRYPAGWCVCLLVSSRVVCVCFTLVLHTGVTRPPLTWPLLTHALLIWGTPDTRSPDMGHS